MLTKTNICLVLSFLTRKALYATVAVTLDIFFFVYVNLRCIVNNQKKISKMSTLPPLLEIFCGRPWSPVKKLLADCFKTFSGLTEDWTVSGPWQRLVVNRVARLALLTPNSRNLAFFKVVWHEKMVFGMYVIVWHFFWPFLIVLAWKNIVWHFLKPLAQLLLSAWN